MLVLSRKAKQELKIGGVTVKVLRITESRVTLGIEAEDYVKVLRSELEDEKDKAA